MAPVTIGCRHLPLYRKTEAESAILPIVPMKFIRERRGLNQLCQEQLGWKRTTTYTVIKRLGDCGVLKNEGGTVTSLVSKDEAQASEIDELVEKKFEGSLPAFIAAFTKHQDLSEDELDEVQYMIDRIRKGDRDEL